ncbi:MAG: hypothetical protein R3F42_08090 [Pseudomonadota bacterium]
MSDTTNILQLPGAALAAIEREDDSFILHFSRLYLLQEMEGAFEDSLWTQALDIVIRGATLDGSLPDCPCVIQGGDLTDNIYTYRDHAPLPIRWRGAVGCRLFVSGTRDAFGLQGTAMEARQIDHPRYIKHIKKDWHISQEL